MELNFKKIIRAFNKSDNAPATPSSPIVPEVPRAGSLQDLKLTSIGGHQHDFSINPVVNTNAEELFDYRDNPDAEREVLEGIDKNFFEDDYDAARFEIENTTDFANTTAIEQRCKKLAFEKHVVSKKVSEKVLAKQQDCSLGVAKVASVRSALSEILLIIKHSRNALRVYHTEITDPAMQVVKFHHQRNEISCILQFLHVLKALNEADTRVQRLLEEGKLAAAVRILGEAQAAALTYSQFVCVRKLHGKFRDTLLAVKEVGEKRLAQLCAKFDSIKYMDVMQAFWHMGECHYVIDQLHLHVLATIRNRSTSVVAAFAQFSQAHSLYSEQYAKTSVSALMSLSGAEVLFGNADIREFCWYSAEDVRFMAYQDLCQRVAPVVFTKCLLKLCQGMWETLKSYNSVLDWHQTNDLVEVLARDGSLSETSEDAAGSGTDTSVLKEYVSEKLLRGPVRVWQEVQNKVSSLVASSHLASFKFDEFLEVLDVVHRLMEIGDELCSKVPAADAEGQDRALQHQMLQESLRQQSGLYLKNYHVQRMDELRTFLECELWEPCPVRPGFSVFMMEEFRFLKRIKLNSSEANRNGSLLTVSFLPFVSSSFHNKSLLTSAQTNSYFGVYADDGSNPFHILDNQNTENESFAGRHRTASSTMGYSDPDDDGFASSDDEVTEELKKEFVDEGSGDEGPARDNSSRKQKKSNTETPRSSLSRLRNKEDESAIAPLLPNTSLALLRLCGKYLQLLLLLRPVAFDVLVCISHLFEFYVFSLCKFFSPDLYAHLRRPDQPLDMAFRGGTSDRSSGDAVDTPTKLIAMLRRIQENIVLTTSGNGGESVSGSPPKDSNERHRFLPPEPHMDDPQSLEPMAVLKRAVVAGESVTFIAGQYQSLRQHFEAHIPASRKAYVDQFFSKSVGTAPLLKDPFFACAVRSNINSSRVLALMSQINWDVHEMKDTHNSYVDVLLRELQVFLVRLDELTKWHPVSAETRKSLWFHAVRHAVRLFVEGFSACKKCSFYGRSWMLLDFRQFLQKLSRFADLNPIPECSYVEEYLRAYYKSDIEIEEWIKSHPEYRPQHVASLITCMPHLSKKARQQALALVGESEKGPTVAVAILGSAAK